MKKISLISLMAISLLVGCAAGVKTTTQKEAKTYTFGTPEGFSVTSMNGTTVVLSYDYNGAVDGGYKIYFGDTTELKGFTGSIPSPTSTPANSVTVGNIPEGTKMYFAVSAYKADGTESAKTTTLSITPVPLAGTEKQHTVSAYLEACIDQLDKITFKEGKMFLSHHDDGTAFPGQADDCAINGIRLHTTEHIKDDKNGNGTFENTEDPNTDEVYDIDRVIPSISEDPWAPTFEDDYTDLSIYKIVTTKPMLITDLTSISKSCVAIGLNKVEATLENDSAGVPNTVVMDASHCGSDKGMNFVNGDKGTINFTLTYTSTDG